MAVRERGKGVRRRDTGELFLGICMFNMMCRYVFLEGGEGSSSFFSYSSYLFSFDDDDIQHILIFFLIVETRKKQRALRCKDKCKKKQTIVLNNSVSGSTVEQTGHNTSD